MAKEIEIPEGYEARIEGNKVIIEQKESEDERIKEELISFLRTGQPYFCPNTNKRTEWANWVEKQKEQKPTEWSEEDKEIINSLIKYHYDQGEISSKHNKWASWLVSFSPQLQMVYKTTIESILKLCNSCDLNKQFGAKAMDFWGNVKLKCEDALKSRKLLNIVYWKPKEEQIEALNKVIENHSSLLRKDDILSPIIELCTDLEKL